MLRFSFVIWILLFFMQTSYSQITLEWESDAQYYWGVVQDMDFDGIFEFYYIEDQSFSSIKIVDGSNHNLKYSVNLDPQSSYIYFGDLQWYFRLFLDMGDYDSDGVIDFILNDPGGDYNKFQIRSTLTNNIIFELNDPNFSFDYEGLLDVDLDGFKELIIRKININNSDEKYLQIYSTNMPVNLQEEQPRRIKTFSLSQNYPNPFNSETTINYDVPKSGNVVLNIYDNLGRLVRTLEDSFKTPGEHSLVWDGKDENGNIISSGFYYYQLKLDNELITKSMILLK